MTIDSLPSDCPKCGEREAFADLRVYYSAFSDKLVHTCKTCGYKHLTLPKDAAFPPNRTAKQGDPPTR